MELFHIPKFRSTRVLWLYYELQGIYGEAFPKIKVHRLDPSTFREVKTKALLEVNPNGKIPAFIDNGIKMFDGCAILNYLLDHYDVERRLGDKSDKAFSADFYKV